MKITSVITLGDTHTRLFAITIAGFLKQQNQRIKNSLWKKKHLKRKTHAQEALLHRARAFLKRMKR